MWKVIAADDEAYIRQGIQKMIPWKELGCEVQKIVSDGKELIDEIETDHPDIVITDIRMPRADGLEVCRYVSEHCPECQVIVLSAYSDFTYAQTAIRYGVSDYVLKIELLEDLPKALEKAVRTLEKQRAEILSKLEAGVDESETRNLYQEMVRYVEQNYRKNFSLADLAEALHANQSYLSRLYKSCSGVNLYDDILQRRIERSKIFLRTSEWKVHEIAAYVGFEDAGYFSRVFRKETGMSPKEFRNAGSV